MRRNTKPKPATQGFWFDIYKADHLSIDSGKTTSLFRLDAVGAPKTWPRITGSTLEEAVSMATKEYSLFCSQKRTKPYPFGDPDLEPHNPAALGCVFVRITNDKIHPDAANS